MHDFSKATAVAIARRLGEVLDALGQAYISSKREGDFFHRFLSHFFETKREILPNFFFITLKSCLEPIVSVPNVWIICLKPAFLSIGAPKPKKMLCFQPPEAISINHFGKIGGGATPMYEIFWKISSTQPPGTVYFGKFLFPSQSIKFLKRFREM